MGILINDWSLYIAIIFSARSRRIVSSNSHLVVAARAAIFLSRANLYFSNSGFHRESSPADFEQAEELANLKNALSEAEPALASNTPARVASRRSQYEQEPVLISAYVSEPLNQNQFNKTESLRRIIQQELNHNTRPPKDFRQRSQTAYSNCIKRQSEGILTSSQFRNRRSTQRFPVCKASGRRGHTLAIIVAWSSHGFQLASRGICHEESIHLPRPAS